jgi:hypothetical protein
MADSVVRDVVFDEAPCPAGDAATSTSGCPKTGTWYLQGILPQSREELLGGLRQHPTAPNDDD